MGAIEVGAGHAVSGARTGDLSATLRLVNAGVRLASDLLEELAACELLVVGQDGGADEYALQDLVVVDLWHVAAVFCASPRSSASRRSRASTGGARRVHPRRLALDMMDLAAGSALKTNQVTRAEAPQSRKPSRRAREAWLTTELWMPPMRVTPTWTTASMTALPTQTIMNMRRLAADDGSDPRSGLLIAEDEEEA